MLVKKMLVVDDDQLVGWALEKGLSANDFQLSVVETGREALLEIEKASYHLILLEVHLPDTNGLDLLGEITRKSPHSRVIVTGADASDQNRERAYSGGAFLFLEKPFTLSTIQSVVKGTLGHSAQRRKHTRYFCSLPLHIDLLGPFPKERPYTVGTLHGNAVDVGDAGIRLHTKYPLTEGQGVRLKFTPPSDSFLKFLPPSVNAEVRWVSRQADGITAGLQFLR